MKGNFGIVPDLEPKEQICEDAEKKNKTKKNILYIKEIGSESLSSFQMRIDTTANGIVSDISRVVNVSKEGSTSDCEKLIGQKV